MAKLQAIKPLNKSSKYFLNTYHWWKPLSDFLFDKCGSLFQSGEIESCYSIEGHTVDGMTAQLISDRLERLLENGTVRAFEAEIFLAYPPYQCGYCNGKGIYPDGCECIACHGQGKGTTLFQ